MPNTLTSSIAFFEDATITKFDKRVTAIKILEEVRLNNMDNVAPPVPDIEADVFRWYHIQTEEQREALFWMFSMCIGETCMNEAIPLPSVVYVETTDASWLEYADQEDLDPDVVEYSYFGTLADAVEHIENFNKLIESNGLYDAIASICPR